MLQSVRFEDDKLILLDQRKLPVSTKWVECGTWKEVADAIRTMVVRGAPAIGISAAYGLALAARAAGIGQASEPGDTRGQRMLDQAAEGLIAARPTAVNLAWAVKRMQRVAQGVVGTLYHRLLEEADRMAEEDLAMCKAMGAAGLPLIPQDSTVMTHCNAGALATAGYGTALGVLRAAHEAGRNIKVIASETRPLLQGARLTAWELKEDGIPVTLITDNMAGHVMKTMQVKAVVVGADRIAKNGDVANKIGTYGLSVLAKHHGIPFYVAAPASTIDVDTPTGDTIVIEERNPDEVTHVGGVQIAPAGIKVYNPAFDVTPAGNITAIITDAGVIYPPFEAALRAVAATCSKE